ITDNDVTINSAKYPKISIITAVRNGASAIPHTLESIRQQTYHNIEHIVVDGASTDGTPRIVREEGARTARLISEPDEGVYDAFNKGLRFCSGEIVAYLNAGDEYAHANVVKLIAEEFDRTGADA